MLTADFTSDSVNFQTNSQLEPQWPSFSMQSYKISIQNYAVYTKILECKSLFAAKAYFSMYVN